jgi:hypothetical protein
VLQNLKRRKQMLKKTITYTDYNGEERTEDFYFNLTKAELTEMQLSKEGGFAEWLEKMVKAKNNAEIIKVFKQILFKSYGVKSDDGRRFIKSEALSEEFSQTEAYNQLFIELIENESTMADFINNVMPRDLAEKAKEQAKLV